MLVPGVYISHREQGHLLQTVRITVVRIIQNGYRESNLSRFREFFHIYLYCINILIFDKNMS